MVEANSDWAISNQRLMELQPKRRLRMLVGVNCEQLYNLYILLVELWRNT